MARSVCPPSYQEPHHQSFSVVGGREKTMKGRGASTALADEDEDEDVCVKKKIVKVRSRGCFNPGFYLLVWPTAKHESKVSVLFKSTRVGEPLPLLRVSVGRPFRASA